MSKLQKYQREYAVRRVHDVYHEKAQNLTKTPNGFYKTELEIVNMIITGKIKMYSHKTMRDSASNRQLRNRHSFPDLSQIFDLNIDAKKENKERKAALAALEKEEQEIIDKIMLMDSEETLELIKQFS